MIWTRVSFYYGAVKLSSTRLVVQLIASGYAFGTGNVKPSYELVGMEPMLQ